MSERVREVKIVITIETNKRTIVRTIEGWPGDIAAELELELGQLAEDLGLPTGDDK